MAPSQKLTKSLSGSTQDEQGGMSKNASAQPGTWGLNGSISKPNGRVVAPHPNTSASLRAAGGSNPFPPVGVGWRCHLMS